MRELAEAGLLISVDKETYEGLKSRGRNKAREYIRHFNAHNQKFQVNYSVNDRQYYKTNSPQYSVSTYTDFIPVAIKAEQANSFRAQGAPSDKEQQNALVAHYTKALDLFNIPKSEMQKRGRNRGTELAFEPPENEGNLFDNREIAGLQREIEELESEFEEATGQLD